LANRHCKRTYSSNDER